MIQIQSFRAEGKDGKDPKTGKQICNDFLALQAEENIISVTVIQHKTSMVYNVVYRTD